VIIAAVAWRTSATLVSTCSSSAAGIGMASVTGCAGRSAAASLSSQLSVAETCFRFVPKPCVQNPAGVAQAWYELA